MLLTKGKAAFIIYRRDAERGKAAMSRLTDMTKGSPTKHLLLFALPLLVTNVGQQLYMIVDAAIVGRGVGVSALASVGATDWIYWLIHLCPAPSERKILRK